MARWAPELTDTLDELAAETLHNYGTGRPVIAIDAPPALDPVRFADELVAAFVRAGRTASATAAAPYASDAAGPDRYRSGYDVDRFRTEVIRPFRAGDGDVLLVVAGEFLLQESMRPFWSSSVLLTSREDAGDDAQSAYVREADPRLRTVATVDVTDPAHPRRVFTDAC